MLTLVLSVTISASIMRAASTLNGSRFKPQYFTRKRKMRFHDLLKLLLSIKNCEGYVQNACGSGVNKVQGQGFLKYGKNPNADARDQVTTQKDGTFTMKLGYSSTSDINNVDLYVNGSQLETMKLPNTNGYSHWKNYEKKITLKKGANTIELQMYLTSHLPSVQQNPAQILLPLTIRMSMQTA